MTSINTLKRIEAGCEAVHQIGQKTAEVIQGAADCITVSMLNFMVKLTMVQVTVRKKALDFIVMEKAKIEEEIVILEACEPTYKMYAEKYSK